jgi:hypothetical protein
MNKFLKTLAIFSSAMLFVTALLLVSYLYYDPFKVVKTYNDYSYPHVITDRDYISTEMFIKNDPKYHYNSFIFGSSRTTGFNPNSWVKYLPPQAAPFMFDASSESIYGIDIKLKYLFLKHVPLKNVLIVMCRDENFKESGNSSEHLYIKHPLLSGQSWLGFQLTFFKAYATPKFLWHFYDFMLTGKYKTNMTGYIEYRKMKYDTINNQQRILDQEEEITNNPSEYYDKRKDLFYKRNGERVDSLQRIKREHFILLEDIKNILEKSNTSYKIVLSPLYEQIAFNKKDLSLLNDVFPGHVYDFSGKNIFTDKVTNYYETSHYRPQVGDSILKIIYTQPPPVHKAIKL